MKRAIIFFVVTMAIALNAGALTIYTVTKTTDPDPYVHPYNFNDSLCDPDMYGTLQWAIRKSLDTQDECRINFNIPGNGPFAINLNYALPTIEKNTVTIDGSTQVGYSQGNPQIYIDGNYKQITGIYFNNLKNSVIKGIVFQHFISQAVLINYCESYQVTECYFLQNGSSDSKIEPAAIKVIHSSNGIITGNRIGIDASGNEIGNEAIGIILTNGSNNNIIGGTTQVIQNTIAKNHKIGVWVTRDSRFNNITGNIFINQDVAISLSEYGNQNKKAPSIMGYSYPSGDLDGTSDPLDIIEVFGSTGNENANEYIGTVIADSNGHWVKDSIFTNYDYFIALSRDMKNNSSPLSFPLQRCSQTVYPCFNIVGSSTICCGQSITIVNCTQNAPTTGWYYIGYSSGYAIIGIPCSSFPYGASYTFTPPCGQPLFNPPDYSNGLIMHYSADPCGIHQIHPITIYPIPHIAIASSTQPICLGDPVTITASITNNTSASFIWSNGSTSNTITVYPTVTTTYTVTATGLGGCTNANSITIIVTDPVPAIVASATCAHSPAHFFGTSTCINGVASWSWNFGDPSSGINNVSNLQNPTHTYTSSGTYIVTLVIIDINGHTWSTSSIITILQGPIISEIIGDFHNCNSANGSISHYSLSNPPSGIHYSWQFPLGNGYFVGSNPSVPNMIDGIDMSSVDVVWNDPLLQSHIDLIVTATDGNGCSSTDTLTIYQCCRPTINQPENVIWTDQVISSPVTLSYKDIYVNGVVQIKDASNFSACNFYMGPNSKIIIKQDPMLPGNPTVLIESKSVLQSCDHINTWDGIFIIDQNANLKMKTSTAKESKNAIVSVNGGKYTIVQNEFDLNWKSLWVKPYYLSNNSTFERNTITCSGSSSMLYPYNNQRSYVGVEIENNSSIVIGNANTFSNLGMGIHVVGSNTVIKGNTFNNINLEPWQFVKSCIWIQGKFQGNSPALVSNIQEGNKFNNCYEGVIIEGPTNVSVTGNSFTNISRNAIYYQKLKGNNVVISSNNITNAGNGIFAYMPGVSNSVISNNTITWTSNSLGTGIKFFGSNNVNEKVKVGLLNDINVTKASKGIWMRNVEKPVIDNNFITLQNKTGTLQTQYAIHLQDCGGASVTDNQITANGNPTATNTSYGILVELSESSNIICNNIKKTGFAIQAASACPGSKIYNNSMKQAYYGFTLTNGGVVGPQGSSTDLSDNTWTGVTYNFWSFNSNGQYSTFHIRSTPASYNPYWDPTWKNGDPFTTFAIETQTYTASINTIKACEMVWPHIISDLSSLRQIAQNQSNTNIENNSEIWLKKKALRKIIKYNTILQSDPVLRNYYDSTKMQGIGMLDSVMVDLRNENFSNASSLNAVIPNTNLLANNEKRINEIEINHLAYGADYSQAEIDELREMAMRCPFTDGKAVYRARTLLVELDPFNTDYSNDCEQMMTIDQRSMEAMADNSTKNAKFVIYPNPSNGLITITCSQEESDKQYSFEMFNMVGQSMKTTNIVFAAQSASISIDDLCNGVYYYRLSDQTGTAIESGKIVLLKP